MEEEENKITSTSKIVFDERNQFEQEQTLNR
jgi:hypothetical protein